MTSLLEEFNIEKVIVVYNKDIQESLVIKTIDLLDLENTFMILSEYSVGSNVEVSVVKGIDGYREYHPLKYYYNSISFIIEALTWIKGDVWLNTLRSNSSSEKLITSYLLSKGFTFYLERANTIDNTFSYIEVIFDVSHKELDISELNKLKKELINLTGEIIEIYFDNIKELVNEYSNNR